MAKEIEFVCSDCNTKYRVITGNYPWENGYRHIGYTRNVCRTCYNRYYERTIIKNGAVRLRVDLENNIVHDLPNSDLHYTIAFSRDTVKSAWGNTSDAKLIRFIGPDGAVWSGSGTKWQYHVIFKRIATKPQNIAKG